MNDEATIGHNSDNAQWGNVAVDKLQSVVRRMENLAAEIKERQEDGKEVMAEAKSSGLNPKIIRQILRIRAADPNKLEEEEILRDLYLRAVS